MSYSNSPTNYVLPSSDVRFWISCVCFDIYEEANLGSGWIQAFDFARHRGADFNLMLEHWSNDFMH